MGRSEGPQRPEPTPDPGPGLPAQGSDRQPRLGLGGLAVVVPFFGLAGFALGGPERSLLVLGPLTTFALPVIATVAFWWQDWPGARLRPGWSGLSDTLLVVVAAVALTILGQAVTGHVDLRGVFAPGPGHPPTFPVTLALGGSAFTLLLQLTVVCEGWPTRRLGWFWGGVTALVVAFGVAVAAYLLLVNLDDVPAAMRDAERLRNPGGPVPAALYSAALLLLGVWQVAWYIALRGWPFTLIRRRGLRLTAGNAAVAVGTAGTFVLLRSVAGWGPDQINAVSGTAIAAGLLVSMLFDGWPASRLGPVAERVCTLLLVALVAALLYAALSAYAGQVEWRRAKPAAWVAIAALNYLALGIVLHVALWQRWPVVRAVPRIGRGAAR